MTSPGMIGLREGFEGRTILLCAPEAATELELATRRTELCRLTADQAWAWRFNPGTRTWRLEYGRR